MAVTLQRCRGSLSPTRLLPANLPSLPSRSASPPTSLVASWLSAAPPPSPAVSRACPRTCVPRSCISPLQLPLSALSSRPPTLPSATLQARPTHPRRHDPAGRGACQRDLAGTGAGDPDAHDRQPERPSRRAQRRPDTPQRSHAGPLAALIRNGEAQPSERGSGSDRLDDRASTTPMATDEGADFRLC